MAAHFSVHLAANKFSSDERTLVTELKSLKRIVRHYYENKPVSDVWQCILRCRRSELPNLCMLVEIVMAMGVGNGFVKSCFDILTSMLSDRRLSMSHSTMADLLLIRANHLAWSEKEHEDLISDTVRTYMLSRRNCSQPPVDTEAISCNIDDLLPDSGDDDDDDDDDDNEPLQSDDNANGGSDHSNTDHSESNDDFGAADIDMADSNMMPPPTDSDIVIIK